jgi:hypothetical protein
MKYVVNMTEQMLLGAPLTVTAIHPRGNTFIYDVTVTDAVMAYHSPAEAKAVDRDF